MIRLASKPVHRILTVQTCECDDAFVDTDTITYLWGWCVPRLISGSKLREAVTDGTFILDGIVSSVENVKYDFHIGGRVLKASYGQPIDLAKIPEEKRVVEPGEAVFVLTKEKLNLPNNILASLTPKRKLAHGGIITLGGLTVDPMYKGVLLIGLYNFSSTPFPLREGKKIIGALFYELDAPDVDKNIISPDEINDFPDELISLIKNYTPVEMNGLGDRVAELGKELTALRSDLANDKTWRDDFKKGLDKHDVQLDKLIQSLNTEVALRAEEDKKMHDKLDGMSKMFWGLGLAKGLVVVLIIAAISATLGYYVPKLLSGSATVEASLSVAKGKS